METNLIIASVIFAAWAIISTYWGIRLRKKIDALKAEKKYIVERGEILIQVLNDRIKKEAKINRGFNERRLGYEAEIKELNEIKLEYDKAALHFKLKADKLIDINAALLEAYEQLKN